jgi:BlaI family transcriptional regulator, penicillinase repressor
MSAETLNPQISESEAKVMDVLWRAPEAPLSTEQIYDALLATEEWHISTVKTLLARLVKKGAIRAEADGRRFLYLPLVSRDAYVSAESRSFLKRMFDGKVAPLVSHFATQQKLTKRDLRELRRLLDELDHE